MHQVADNKEEGDLVIILRRYQLTDTEVSTKVLLASGVLWFALFLIAPGVPAQQAPTAGRMRLSKIEFNGLQRYSQEEAIAASGLQIGQLVDVPTLDAAAQRLFDSGLFKKLSYRYRTTGNQAVVTFQTEEEKGAVAPVVFDNFVWFSDEELLTAVRRQVPSFAGTANVSATNGITKALQQLLQDRKMAGRVEYMPSGDLSGGNVEHLFSVEGVTVPICTVHFAGATAQHESDLIKRSKLLIAIDYKRSFVGPFATVNLFPIYREWGHLRARFGTPTAKLESDTTGDCKSGVSVTVPVEEGLLYSWGKAEWSGNAALSNPELERALKMKNGELANGLKIDKGLLSVQEAYGKQGYLTARIKDTPVFEDASQSVTYQIGIEEGPQYHMGMLTITGLSEDRTNELKRKWKLQPGSVYDDSYIHEFIKKDFVLDASEIGSPPRSISTDFKFDRRKFIVDVTISLKKGE
jgi:outer membrane protein assembly factor BamA